jgi:hypothetical protein
MSWLRRLLGGAEAAPEGDRAAPVRVTMPSHARGIVSVPELDMVGERVTSRNGRFTLLWRDRHWADGVPIQGRYLLIDGDAIIVDRRMERPQDGKAADDGTFVLNDWGDSQELSGTFHAFRSDGSEIVSRAYTANLLNNGLSHDGRLAVCQTANAPGSPDSSVLTVFDLESGAGIATWTAESGWANAYEFPEGGALVRMIRHERPSLDYTLGGEFIDRRVWLKDEVARGTVYVIRKALAEGEAATGVSNEALRAGAERAVADEDQRFVADTWRLLGEIEEAAGNATAALEAYEHALRINPKIGVAKRASALRNMRAS